MNRVLFISFLIAIAAPSGESVKCYVCNSVNEKDCEHDPKSHGLEPVQCNTDVYKKSLKDRLKGAPIDFNFHPQIPESAFACLKIDVEVRGEKIIERNCVPSKNNPVDACKIYKSMFSAISASSECNICEEDGCNGATLPSPNIFQTLLLTAISFVLTVYRPLL